MKDFLEIRMYLKQIREFALIPVEKSEDQPACLCSLTACRFLELGTMLTMESKIINKREIRVFAMKRSGHHAVIHWLLLHFAGPVYFLNNCGFVDSAEFLNHSPTYDGSDRPDPYRETRVGTGTSSVYYRDGRMIQKFRHYQPTDRRSETLLDRLKDMERAERSAAEDMGFPDQRDCYLFNIEDFNLRDIGRVPFETLSRGWSESVQSIVILRDPFNWIASRMRRSLSVSSDILQAWVSHAREALGQAKHLPSPPLIINYNRWHIDAGYRRSLSLQLGLPPTSEGLQDVLDFGEGSSFEGQSYHGRGNEMAVLDRWKHYRDDPSFRTVFAANPKLISLSERLFGLNPFRNLRRNAGESASDGDLLSGDSNAQEPLEPTATTNENRGLP